MLRYIGYFLTTLTVLLLVAVLGSVFIFYKYGSELPDYKQLQVYEPPILTRFYANDGRLFAEYATEKRIFIPEKNIPNIVKQAFIATEDKNFYEHIGLDFMGIVRAVLRNFTRILQGKRVMGASTITQQVARNFLLTETQTLVSLERKIKEAILSFRIEHAFSKEHILELYLNEIYLGNRSYGVAAAALSYFNKTLDELTVPEVAYLAALPKAPSRYHPTRNRDRAIARRNYVIERLYEEGHIPATDVADYKNTPLEVAKPRDFLKNTVRSDFFAEEVRRQLASRFGDKVLYESGLTIRTTLDPELQVMANSALKDGLIAYDRRHGFHGPFRRLSLAEDQDPTDNAWREKMAEIKNFPGGIQPWEPAVVTQLENDKAIIVTAESSGHIPLSKMTWARKRLSSNERGPEIKKPSDVVDVGHVIFVNKLEGDTYELVQVPEVSGAILVMNPHTGQVLAMSGGYSFQMSQFNRATQAQRQLGSSFKPFLYLKSFEEGLTPVTVLDDSPIAIDVGEGQDIYKPKNYTKNFLGPLTLRRGLQLSQNIITIRLIHEHIGVDGMVEIGRRMGIYQNLPPYISMSLGAGESTLINLASAYASLVNGGRKVAPTFIDRVQDRRGKNMLLGYVPKCVGCAPVFEDGMQVPLLIDDRDQLVDPVNAYQIISILEGATKHGTSRRARAIGKPVAGKTGTSNDFNDAFYVGFSPDLLCAVFVGFDQPRSMGNHESGARVALPIFVDFMSQALKTKPATPFRVPDGTTFVRVNRETGLRAKAGESGAIMEAFKAGTETAVQRPEDVADTQLKKDQATQSIGSGGLY